jgi:hypothetical protein
VVFIGYLGYWFLSELGCGHLIGVEITKDNESRNQIQSMKYRQNLTLWTVIATAAMMIASSKDIEPKHFGILLVMGIFTYAVSGTKSTTLIK